MSGTAGHGLETGEKGTDGREGEDAAKETDTSDHAPASQHAPADAALHALDTAVARTHISASSSRHHSPGLHINTHMDTSSLGTAVRLQETPTIYETPLAERTSSIQSGLTSPGSLTMIGSALRSARSNSSINSIVSHGSATALTSPYLAAMSDLTPLPSPQLGSDSSKRHSGRFFLARPGTPQSREGSMDELGLGLVAEKMSPPVSRKRKGYSSLLHDAMTINPVAMGENSRVGDESHGRNRSISDFTPEHLQNLRQRHVTYGPGAAADIESQEHHMHREEYLATKRGLTAPITDDKQQQLPTPPASNSSVGESDEAEDEQPLLTDGSRAEYLVIRCGVHNKRRKFRELRQLGQGTFSKVMLATSEKIPAHPTPEIEEHLDSHKLVAVKVVEQGPAGGADEQRIEIGLKREVEMLKSLSHPSLIHLKACEYQESRALLVLTYCPGGDLFEFASQKRELLTPPLIQRIFAELVHAVRYLHTNWIVHRDIKLENVLVNLPPAALQSLQDPRTHSTPIVTLTDLGLSRRIPEPPESPLLTTRCGSEDYAAPEILLGQPYDGRSTDAWALGVLLYALMEGRLPFDAPPGKPERSRNTHRIARCDWIWCRFGDDDGEWDAKKSGGEFEGARACVEGLLKKVRMGRKSVEEIGKMDWVEEGIRVVGGLKPRVVDEDDGLF
ncbi:kinase-like domain-containing protein [Neohortaea acidophila]|uniref:non-specific serine/threonine protein kinase n=1 Tax=Neohortaea acidophila TaxID=245834 RepID=A0A6A6PR79_9PEZI|nr:kinase-like domain-containing protein [Neohortaea acidophila]KAF2481717.1 kinase-like domain-containing protein [Neohortaea acidophila]